MDQEQRLTAYQDLAEDAQVTALLPVGAKAAELFGLEVASLDLVAHAYNTTFSVTTPGGERWALRVNTASESTPEEVDTQQAWQLAIAAETEVRVAVPRPTTDGDWWARVPSDALGRAVLVTCASWLTGEDVDDPWPEVARALGRAMALLHGHARTWWRHAEGTMPLFDEPFLGERDSLGSASWLDAAQHDVLREARKRTFAAFARVYAGAEVIPLHADLHGANLKWHEGRLAIFDFDDCGLGVPALDLATTAFYLRGPDPAPEEALLEGYAEVAPLPEVDPQDLEAIIASRQLLLAAVVLNSSTASPRADAQAYSVTAVDRLRHWLATGRFTRALP